MPELTILENEESKSINIKEVKQKNTRIQQLKLRKEIDDLMVQEKLFLKADLKISDLSELLATNRTYIYEAIKLSYGNAPQLNFSDYVNNYRIRFCIELMKNNDKNSNIEDLAYESGFSSKATFYNNFKKFTGTTPKTYITKYK